jgi:hypothetical protein
MSLQAELDAFRNEFMAEAPPEIREAMGQELDSADSSDARRHGNIALAFVDVDYRIRVEPAQIISTLRALSEKRPQTV